MTVSSTSFIPTILLQRLNPYLISLKCQEINTLHSPDTSLGTLQQIYLASQITWQCLSAFRRVDMVKTTCLS